MSNLRHHRPSLDQQQKPSPTRQRFDSEQPATKQHPSRARPQSVDDLFKHKPPNEIRPGSHDILTEMAASIEQDTISSIDAGYANIHARKPSPPPTLDKPATRRPEHARMAPPPPRSPSQSLSQTPAQREAQRYGMFMSSHRRNSTDALFVGDDSDSDEAVQVPGMQEVDLEADTGGGEKKAMSLGKSILGAPKRPPNATGEAPVAPMMHISPAAKNGGDDRAK